MVEIKGIIFPISEKNYNAIINGKNVYVKICTFKNLKPSQIIQFYVTPKKKVIIKGKITSVENLDYDSMISKYENKLVQGKNDLYYYMNKNMKGQKRVKNTIDHSHALAIQFGNIEKCDINPHTRIWTMGIAKLSI
jgi:hypothetical protein